MEKSLLASGLYIVSTPIGNLGDITFRAIDVLKSVEVILCEDTRVSRVLLQKYSISTKVVSFHNYNEGAKIDSVVKIISGGRPVALISDAGTPLISDPGYKVVERLRREKLPVFVVPGATSVISALVLSGFPTDAFTFIGFVPVKNGERREFFSKYVGSDNTIIFFETAGRLGVTLKVLNDIFPKNQIAIVREITKVYEETRVGLSSELLEFYLDNPIRGEIVGLIKMDKGNCEEVSDMVIIEALSKLRVYMPLSPAADFLSQIFAISKKRVYNIGIKINKEER